MAKKQTKAQPKAQPKANALTAVRNKFLLKAGIDMRRVRTDIDEQVLNARVLTPLCAIDLAYAAFQTLDKDFFKQSTKMWYKEIQGKFHVIFNRNGILYKGLTDDEMLTAVEYMEKIEQSVKKDMEILKWQIHGHLMHMPMPDRSIAATLILMMTICCYSHDMLERDLHTDFVELTGIAKRASRMVDAMMKTLFGKNAPDVVFTDDQFTLTLTVLFKRLTEITTEGIQ